MNQAFIVTKEHRRFTEFANAVRKEKTIGICHGAAGVGKTNSARRYANWEALEPYINEWGPRGDHDAKHYALANRSRTVFYTPEVLCRPKDLMHDIDHWQVKVGICADEHLRSLMPESERVRQNDVTRLVELLIVDEAERLTPTALELLRDQHDRTHLAMILIGMPGIDERFRHYPQLYSRLGFSHHYRALGRDELLFVRQDSRPGRLHRRASDCRHRAHHPRQFPPSRATFPSDQPGIEDQPARHHHGRRH